MLNKTTPAMVRDLWGDARYRQAVGDIEALAPMVPDYDPDANNVEQIKFHSARKQMHDLVMTILKPKGE